MSIRARPSSSVGGTSTAATNGVVYETLKTSTAEATTADDDVVETPKPPRRSSSLRQRALSQTLTGTANLANLLPTGTLLAFQLLTPVFTNNGSCDSVTRPLTFFLLALCAVSCFVACFTDSVRASDEQVYYGFVTFKGMWVIDYEGAAASGASFPDLSKYKLGFIDFVHAVLSVFVFAAVALRDKNVLNCFYPMPAHETQEVLDIVPLGMGLLSSLLFMMFPTRRHGIGFPVTPSRQ